MSSQKTNLNLYKNSYLNNLNMFKNNKFKLYKNFIINQLKYLKISFFKYLEYNSRINVLIWSRPGLNYRIYRYVKRRFIRKKRDTQKGNFKRKSKSNSKPMFKSKNELIFEKMKRSFLKKKEDLQKQKKKIAFKEKKKLKKEEERLQKIENRMLLKKEKKLQEMEIKNLLKKKKKLKKKEFKSLVKKTSNLKRKILKTWLKKNKIKGKKALKVWLKKNLLQKKKLKTWLKKYKILQKKELKVWLKENPILRKNELKVWLKRKNLNIKFKNYQLKKRKLFYPNKKTISKLQNFKNLFLKKLTNKFFYKPINLNFLDYQRYFSFMYFNKKKINSDKKKFNLLNSNLNSSENKTNKIIKSKKLFKKHKRSLKENSFLFKYKPKIDNLKKMKKLFLYNLIKNQKKNNENIQKNRVLNKRIQKILLKYSNNINLLLKGLNKLKIKKKKQKVLFKNYLKTYTNKNLNDKKKKRIKKKYIYSQSFKNGLKHSLKPNKSKLNFINKNYNSFYYTNMNQKYGFKTTILIKKEQNNLVHDKNEKKQKSKKKEFINKNVSNFTKKGNQTNRKHINEVKEKRLNKNNQNLNFKETMLLPFTQIKNKENQFNSNKKAKNNKYKHYNYNNKYTRNDINRNKVIDSNQLKNNKYNLNLNKNRKNKFQKSGINEIIQSMKEIVNDKEYLKKIKERNNTKSSKEAINLKKNTKKFFFLKKKNNTQFNKQNFLMREYILQSFLKTLYIPRRFNRIKREKKDLYLLNLIFGCITKNVNLVTSTISQAFRENRNPKLVLDLITHVFSEYSLVLLNIESIILKVKGKFLKKSGSKKVRTSTKTFIFNKPFSFQTLSLKTQYSFVSGQTYLGTFGVHLWFKFK